MKIHVYLHDGLEERMGAIEDAIQNLVTKVNDISTAVVSAITLMNTLKAELDQLGADPQKIADIAAQIEQVTQSLNQAISTDTPTG